MVYEKEQDKENPFVSVNTLIGDGKQPLKEFTYVPMDQRTRKYMKL